MIGIGFIGVGNMGRQQADAFLQLDECRIVAASDPDRNSLAAFNELCPRAKTYQDHHQLLDDASVDAVVVSVPTGLHANMVCDVLAASRPVMIEKPMARTIEQCRRMNDAADKAGRLLMVAHVRRFDNDWGTFADAYRQDKLGERVLWRHVMAGLGPPGAWFRDHEMGGGPLMDGAIHNQDFANYLFGPADSVVGSEIKFNSEVSGVDTGSVIVRYRNGCQLLLSWSWAVHGTATHDVLGAKGTFVFGPGDMTPPPGHGGHTLITPDGERHLLSFERTNMFVTQGRHFLDCIAGRTACATPGTEAIKAVAVADAVLKAARTGEVCKVES